MSRHTVHLFTWRVYTPKLRLRRTQNKLCLPATVGVKDPPVRRRKHFFHSSTLWLMSSWGRPELRRRKADRMGIETWARYNYRSHKHMQDIIVFPFFSSSLLQGDQVLSAVLLAKLRPDMDTLSQDRKEKSRHHLDFFKRKHRLLVYWPLHTHKQMKVFTVHQCKQSSTFNTGGQSPHRVWRNTQLRTGYNTKSYSLNTHSLFFPSSGYLGPVQPIVQAD